MSRIQTLIISTLTNLAAAREYEAAYPSGTAPIVEGVTHCESCGFSYQTYRHVVTHRGLCSAPESHPKL